MNKLKKISILFAAVLSSPRAAYARYFGSARAGRHRSI